MKKITLILIMLGGFIITNAQVDKNSILERLRAELLPQTTDKDYNPYKYSREEYIINCLEVTMEYENNDCENVNEIITKYHEADTTVGYRGRPKEQYFVQIARSKCRESYEFLENLIQNDPRELVRRQAIMILADCLNPDYFHCILEYAEKDTLSVYEKGAIAYAFMIYGIYLSYSDLKERAIQLFDEICYEFSSEEMTQSCISNYYKIGGSSAINFINAWGERLGGWRKISAAVFIAELGEFEATFPIFEEAIHSDIPNNIYEAIRGLAVIGTEEALRLIEEQTKNKDERIAKLAQETLEKFNRKGGEK